MKRTIRNHGLSLVLAVLFLATYIGGQLIAGWKVHNQERAEHQQDALGLGEYFLSAHNLEATAENWESEFLQMFVFVCITAFLFQKGSAQSNDPDKSREIAGVTKDSPWPVRRGSWWRVIYAHSLSLAFAFLFLGSFCMHAIGSERLENEERVRQGQPPYTLYHHLGSSKFWFESMQNWQSEFLAILSMVVLTIYLREKGSPESKSLEASHNETGA